MTRHRSRDAGIALAEALLALVLAGVLLLIAYPAFIRGYALASQAECKSDLKSLFMAARAWKAQHGTYNASLTDLRFHPEPTSPYHYRYGTSGYYAYGNTIAATPTNSDPSTTSYSGFTATCVGNIDGDVFNDEWAINNAHQLANGQLPSGTQGDDLQHECYSDPDCGAGTCDGNGHCI